MNFMEALLLCECKKVIMTVVDRFSKYVHFIKFLRKYFT
jgi:hypothetical protein